MRFSKIWLYDNVIIGNNHTTINAALLDVACSLIETENVAGHITMYGEVNHLNILKQSVAARSYKTKIDFTPIRVIAPGSGIWFKVMSWLKKIREDRKELQKMLQNANQEKPDLIIFNTLVAANLSYFFKMIRRRPHLRFLLILHGEIEYFFGKGGGRKKIIGMQYKQAFKDIPGNLKLAVFNEYSRDKLLESGILENSLLHIKHPVSYKPFYKKEIFPSDQINVTHIGVANHRKNSYLIFELAEIFSEKEKDIGFSILGRVGTDVKRFQNDLVHVVSERDSPVPQKRFETEILKSHYSICFFQGEEYIYRVSGSLLDSIAYALPIIALKHPATEELFRQGGDIGFLCNDLEEMKAIINRIADKDSEYVSKYTLQRENVMRLANQYLPENVALSLRDSLELDTQNRKLQEQT